MKFSMTSKKIKILAALRVTIFWVLSTTNSFEIKTALWGQTLSKQTRDVHQQMIFKNRDWYWKIHFLRNLRYCKFCQLPSGQRLLVCLTTVCREARLRRDATSCQLSVICVSLCKELSSGGNGKARQVRRWDDTSLERGDWPFYCFQCSPIRYGCCLMACGFLVVYFEGFVFCGTSDCFFHKTQCILNDNWAHAQQAKRFLVSPLQRLCHFRGVGSAPQFYRCLAKLIMELEFAAMIVVLFGASAARVALVWNFAFPNVKKLLWILDSNEDTFLNIIS